MIQRYKARTIIQADAVMWDGANLAEVQTICPEAVWDAENFLLTIQTETGPTFISVGTFVLRDVGTERISVISGDAFRALYEVT
jgi:hypothetical protein